MMNNNIFSAIVVELNNLNDSQGAQILSIIKGLQSTATPVAPVVTSTPKLSVPEEKSEPKPLPKGKKLYQSDFIDLIQTESGEYRLYINCPVKGEKGDKLRYALKASAKEHGAKFNSEKGAFKAGNIWWVFPNKKSVDSYIKARKEYDANNKKSA